MSVTPVEERVRATLRTAVDPIVPDSSAERRVLDTISAGTDEHRSRRRARRSLTPWLAGVLLSTLVVLVVGGALTVSLALNHATGGIRQPGAAASGGPIPTPSPHPPLLACDGNALTARVVDTTSGVGAAGADIALENTGLDPCTLDGFVNLAAVIGGRPVQLNAAHDAPATLLNKAHGPLPAAQIVTLHVGFSAIVAIEVSDRATTSTACSIPSVLLITPPQDDRYTTLSGWPLALCAGHGVAIWVDETPVIASPYFQGRFG